MHVCLVRAERGSCELHPRYNSFGEPLTVTDPLGNTTTNAYDANGNLTSVTSPAPDATTPASVTHFAYDLKGELTQITDPLGHITTLAYNPVGLISSITDAQGNVTSYEYDARGNRTASVSSFSPAARERRMVAAAALFQVPS